MKGLFHPHAFSGVVVEVVLAIVLALAAGSLLALATGT